MPYGSDKVKKGETQIAFDLKSQRLALNELLGRRGRKYIPKDFSQEVFTEYLAALKDGIKV